MMLICVDGRGGSGKSTWAALFAARHSSPVIAMDDIYLPRAQRPQKPASFTELYDRGRLIEQVLKPLKERKAARYQRYDWETDQLGEWVDVPLSETVLVEGVTSMGIDLVDFFDLSIWIDTPADICLDRGILCDGEKARETWEKYWIPAEEKYLALETPQERADVTITGQVDGLKF